MKLETPTWGIEPVPERLRVLGLLDTTLLWGNLGVSLLVIVAGAFLVPYLSLPQALLAILIGAVVGNAMLALAGLIGADARVPGMVLLRAPLGRQGSYLPTGLNVLQNLGWATFEIIIIAHAAGSLSNQIIGEHGVWAWTLVVGALTLVLALAGPISFVKQWVRRFALWVVIVSLGYLTWRTLDRAALGTLWDKGGEGGLTFWQGVDLTIAMPASWLPLIADYTRFSRRRRDALVGSGIGYFVPHVWLYAIGALFLLDTGSRDPGTIVGSLATSGLLAGLVLLALAVDEVDEPFANVYSTAVSLQNLLPRFPQRWLIAGAAAAATIGALVIDLAQYESFLFLLGSFFVPLFGVLLADWLLSGARYTRADVFAAPAFRLDLVGAWLAGFALYQWLQPVGPGWWLDLLDRLGAGSMHIGASLPSFAAAFVLSALASGVARVVPARG